MFKFHLDVEKYTEVGEMGQEGIGDQQRMANTHTLRHHLFTPRPPQIIISISHPCSTKLFNITIKSKTHHLNF